MKTFLDQTSRSCSYPVIWLSRKSIVLSPYLTLFLINTVIISVFLLKAWPMNRTINVATQWTDSSIYIYIYTDTGIELFIFMSIGLTTRRHQWCGCVHFGVKVIRLNRFIYSIILCWRPHDKTCSWSLVTIVRFIFVIFSDFGCSFGCCGSRDEECSKGYVWFILSPKGVLIIGFIYFIWALRVFGQSSLNMAYVRISQYVLSVTCCNGL